MKKRFRMYHTGELHFVDERVTKPFAFAHITDLHLSPYRKENWPRKYRHAIGWWDDEFEHPHEVLPKLLNEAKSAGVDFVLFGGDNLDCYDPDTADHIVALCRDHELACYFSLGNHDFESIPIRYLMTECDAQSRASNVAQLVKCWQMPGRYYAFDHNGVRFIVLDAPYVFVEGGLAGIYDEEQADWLVEQLKHDGPIVVHYHIPFKLPTNAARLGITWNGIKGWAAEDHNGKRVLAAIADCPNVLGAFAGHTHIRAEDPLADKWQFVTAAGGQHAWRYVRIGCDPPTKSLRAKGRPGVDGDGGKAITEA